MTYNFRQTTRLFFAALILCLGLSGLTIAQEITASLNGTVRDNSGAVVPGATVTVTDPSKNNLVVRTLTTNDDGQFNAPNLPVSTYQITVEAPNFKKSVRTAIKLDVGARRSEDITLEAGNISETVTVQADAVAVNLSTPTAGTTINGDQVRELALNNRNFVQLITLAPGVSSNLNDSLSVGTSDPSTGAVNLVQISVNGARSSQNTYTVDGADITDRGSNLTIQAYPNIDSIGEFKVLRSLFPAESGRSGGGQVNVITRSGEDKFHGSLFEFVRNEKFNANSYFNNQRAPLGVDSNGKARRAPFRYNDYGFTIGGPVFGPNFGEGDGGLVKRYKKTYFFFSEEQRKDRRFPTLFSSVPDAGVRQGIFPIDICLSATIVGSVRTCNNILPAGTPLASRAAINPVAQSYLTNIYNRIPLPNNPAVPFQLVAPASAISDFRQEIVKIDTSFTKNWSAFYRYERDKIPTTDINSLFSSGSSIPGVSTSQTDSPGRTHTFQTTYVVSPNVIIEGRYTYAYGAILSRTTGLVAKANTPVNVPLPFASGDDRIPTITGNGFNGLTAFGPYNNFSNKNDFGASLTWISGRHSFKFGGDYSKYRKNENTLGGSNQGSFSTFSNTNAALAASGAVQGSVCAPSQQTATTGCVTTNNAGNLQAFANFLLGSNATFLQDKFDLTADFRQQNFEGYAQDEFRLRSNLTLYYGVRYSYFGSPYDKNGHLTNFDPSLFNLAQAPQVTGTGIRVAGTGNFCDGLIINSQNVPSLLPPDCRPTVSPFGKYVVKVSKTNFAPRVGIAYDPFGKGRTSIRTGYGIYHEQTLVGTFEQNLGANPPYQQRCNPSFVSLTSIDPTGACQSSGFSVSQSIRAVDPNYKTPYTQDYSFDVQQQLGKNTFLDVGYYGSKGTNLIGIIDIDLLPPGFALTQNCATGSNTLATPGATLVPCQLPGAPLLSSTLINQIRPYRGYSAINIIKPIFNSRYNSLQVSAQQRFSGSSQVNLAYTFSKAITDAQTDRSSAPQNPYNIKAETGRAALDRRHVLTANYIYELPFFRKQNGFVGKALGGWESSGIFTYQTGLPFTVTGGFDPAGIGFFGPSAAGPRPDIIGDPNSNAPHTQQQFFNTSAFPSAFQVSGVPAIPGSSGRGVVNGPRTVRFDFTLVKNIRFSESMDLQLRGDAFNIFNTTNFTTLATAAGTSTFGQVTGTRDPRTLQFGIKFLF
ncbi:MAG: carboxypeptidase regulatory-like domain-containing protein [Pyrinomonadaceae bacterium]